MTPKAHRARASAFDETGSEDYYGIAVHMDAMLVKRVCDLGSKGALDL